MPPRDPRDCPALDRAMPADTVSNGTWREDSAPLEARFGDGSWRLVTVVARWDDRYGRPVVQLEWTAAGTTWREAYLDDPERLREP